MATIPQMQAAIAQYSNKLNPLLLELEAEGERVMGTKDYTATINQSDLKGSVYDGQLCVQTSIIDNDTDLNTAKALSNRPKILDTRSSEIWTYQNDAWVIEGTINSVLTFPRGRYHYSVFNQKTCYITLAGTVINL